jgi:hypothetical protein
MAKDVNFKDASAALRSVRGRNLATVQLPRDSQDCRARVGPGGDVISREPPRLLVTPAGNCPPPPLPKLPAELSLIATGQELARRHKMPAKSLISVFSLPLRR